MLSPLPATLKAPVSSEVRDWTISQIADWMIQEVEEGMDGTPHKAGVIKAGSSYNYISALEEKVFKAAVIAAKGKPARPSERIPKKVPWAWNRSNWLSVKGSIPRA